MSRLKSHAAMFALVIGLLITFNQTARAQACVTNPVVVNVLNSGAGSLRQAVIDACAGSTITFSNAVRGTISLTTGQIVIDKNLTIVGPGADLLTVRNGAGQGRRHRIFAIGSVTTISGLTIADGDTVAFVEGNDEDFGWGGGIASGGTLTLTDCAIRGNKAAGGGGVYNSGTLTVVNSVFSDNQATYEGRTVSEDKQGGAIHSRDGTLTITNSTIVRNRAGERGGGIYGVRDVVRVTDSTITDNRADWFTNDGVNGGAGAGICSSGGKVIITNSTITGNEDDKYRWCGNGNPPCLPGRGGNGILTVVRRLLISGDLVYPELHLINATVADDIWGLSDILCN